MPHITTIHDQARTYSRSVLCTDYSRPHRALYAYTKRMVQCRHHTRVTVYSQLKLAFKPPQNDCKKSKKTEENYKKRRDHILRARTSVFDIVDCNLKKRPLFVTLTYRENQHDTRIARKHFSHFVRVCKNNDFPLKYLAVPERQERGAVHFHIIIFNHTFIPLDILKKAWNHGNVDVVRVKMNDHNHVCAYLASYIAEDLSLATKNQKTFFTSRGLARPLVSRDNDFIDATVYKIEKNQPTLEIILFGEKYLIKYHHDVYHQRRLSRSRKEKDYSQGSRRPYEYVGTVRRYTEQGFHSP